MKFINLRNHTHFTLQLGVGSVDDYLDASVKTKQEGLAITDRMSLGGAIEGYALCQKSKRPFVMGCVLNLVDKRTNMFFSNPSAKIMVFVKNNIGFTNLCRILAKASTPEYFYRHSRVDIKLLSEHKEGLIVSTGDFQSIFAKPEEDDWASSKTQEEWFLLFKKEFGDDFIAEICLQDVSDVWSKSEKTFVKSDINPQVVYNKEILELSKKHNVKFYISNPAYLASEDLYVVQKTMILNSKGNSGWHFPRPLYLKSSDELLKDAIENHRYLSVDDFETGIKETVCILEKCKDLYLSTDVHLPVIKHEDHVAWTDKITDARYEALKNSCKNNHKKFYALLEYADSDKDLKLLIKDHLYKGKISFSKTEDLEQMFLEYETFQLNGVHRLAAYFLLLVEVNNFVNESGESRGFGRGSGAGSLVNYASDITDVEPRVHDLLFERFISRERIGELVFEFESEDGQKIVC